MGSIISGKKPDSTQKGSPKVYPKEVIHRLLRLLRSSFFLVFRNRPGAKVILSVILSSRHLAVKGRCKSKKWIPACASMTEVVKRQGENPLRLRASRLRGAP